MQEMLATLWQQHQSTIVERLDLIARSHRDLLEGNLDPAAWEEAKSAAHKLAGVLGTFGRAEGSNLARKIENWPTGDDGLPQDPQNLAVSIEALREQIQ